MILSNTFNIIMAIFDVSQNAVAGAADIIDSSTAITPDIILDVEEKLQAMDIGPLIGLWFQSLFVKLVVPILNIVIFVIAYGRMIEIYRASRSTAFHPKAVCGHFGNPALASR